MAKYQLVLTDEYDKSPHSAERNGADFVGTSYFYDFENCDLIAQDWSCHEDRMQYYGNTYPVDVDWFKRIILEDNYDALSLEMLLWEGKFCSYWNGELDPKGPHPCRPHDFIYTGNFTPSSICQNCNGTGTTKVGTMIRTCSVCHGTGYVSEERN